MDALDARIEQIGKAITQIEKVTQNAAANSEESAAAAEELSAQSDTLRELMGHIDVETTLVYLRRKDRARDMEAVIDGDDATALRRRAAELECGLDRLRAGARELHALETRRRASEQSLGEEAGHRGGA